MPEGYQEVPIATAVGDRHGHQNFGGEFTHLPLPEAYKILDANSYASFGFNSPAGMAYEGDPVENGDAFMGASASSSIVSPMKASPFSTGSPS